MPRVSLVGVAIFVVASAVVLAAVFRLWRRTSRSRQGDSYPFF